MSTDNKQYKDFDIPIPPELQNEQWVDRSWGNDAAPHMKFHVEIPPHNFELWLWNQGEDETRWECPEAKRFWVDLIDQNNGDEAESTEWDTINEALDQVNNIMRNAGMDERVI